MFLSTPRFLLLAVYLSLIIHHPSLNAQHPAWQNFTTRDGLPSKEIYYMMEDSRGFLWFATEQGICRFNGYEFVRPVDTSAMANTAAFQIADDTQGRIWYMHLDGTLSIIENDTVRSWPYNHLLKAFGEKGHPALRFAVAKDGTVWGPFLERGFLVVQRDGTQRVISSLHNFASLFTELEGKIICSGESALDDRAEQAFTLRTQQTSQIFCWQNEKAIALGRFPAVFSRPIQGAAFNAWRLKNGDIVGRYGQTFYLLHDNRLIWHGQKEVQANQILEDSDGAILLASLTGEHRGLLRFPSLEHFLRNEFDNLLPGHSVDFVLRDHESGWWAATTDAGLFYCKNPTLDILDAAKGLPADDVMRLATDGLTTVYAGFRTADVCAIDQRSGRIMPLPSVAPSGNVEITMLRFDTLNKRLWCAPNLSFLEKDHWTNFKYRVTGSTHFSPLSVKRINPDPSGAKWWGSSYGGFISIDLRSHKATKFPQDASSLKRTFSVTPDFDGTLWVTTLDGLRHWRNGRYELPDFQHPALRFQANCVEFLPDSSMVIALRGGGLLIRDKNGQCTHLTTRDGLTSDVLSDLDISPDDKIYACSNTGLNILSRQPAGGWRIETLTMKNGLPSNQVNDVAFLGDEIWVATDKGIARLRGKPAPVPMPAPVLEKFTVNNRDTIFSPNLRLAHDQNNIALRFFALHFRSGGDIPYRYRLLGGDTSFVYTHTREVNFVNLAPRQYTFEVQAQNEDGQWSEPSRWPFAIRPPWWATWWFRILVGATLAVALGLFYRNRLRAIRQEAALREKVHAMETSALRAQMNPHFIFNCLQAIQSFIANNDRDAATVYLARFAKLVRLALHGSVDGYHSLADEMAMLENYLYLEQLRFGGTFTFNIRAEAGLDPEQITLPPLLVQPFVENALWHGLKGKKSDGIIEVLFIRKGDLLEVSVTDNGTGFSEGKNASAGTIRPYKSMGMMLTQKRLDLLAGIPASGEEQLSRKTIQDKNGAIIGANVRIWIPLTD